MNAELAFLLGAEMVSWSFLLDGLAADQWSMWEVDVGFGGAEVSRDGILLL